MLGDSLLRRDIITLTPQQHQQIKLKRDPQARHLAAFALMREHQHLVWQAREPLTDNSLLVSRFQLSVDESGLIIQPQSWWQMHDESYRK